MVNLAQPIQNNGDTREHIAMVATHLFSYHGYEATSIRDLAEAAGVTKPVLYYYFQSKENLFITLIHEAYEFLIRHWRKSFLAKARSRNVFEILPKCIFP